MEPITFTLTIPTNEAQRIATAICATHQYDSTSGKTPVEFTQEIVFRWLAEKTISYEAQLAADQARNIILSNQDDPLAQAILTQQGDDQ